MKTMTRLLTSVVMAAMSLEVAKAAPSLEEALDAPGLTWTSTGANWFGQTNVTHDAVDAAQSGPAGQNQYSRLETTVTGPAIVSFWEKATSSTSTSYTYLYFYLDGVSHHTVYGYSSSVWQKQTLYLGAGNHTLRWDFWNYNAASNGNSAWVDQVTVTPGGTPPIATANPSASSGWLGGEARFLAAATGTPPFRYRWCRNGAPLVGQTNLVGIITGLTAEDLTNQFSVTVSNDYGDTTVSNLSIYFTGVAAWGANSYNNERIVPAGLSNVAQVACGGYHSLALRNDHTVLGWGESRGATPPAGLANVIAIDAGWQTSLALKSDGTLVAWGLGANALPVGLSNVTAIAQGDNHALALLADGTVRGWGSNQDPYGYLAGQATIPAGLSNVVAISAGDYHSLALRSDGTLVAWGANTNNNAEAAMQATVPPGFSNIVAIAAGGSHNLLLRSDGTVSAWGSRLGGQTNVPAGLSNVVALAGGYMHSLVLQADGKVVAWGKYYDSELASWQTMFVPSGLTNVSRISGVSHNLAILGSGPVPPPSMILANALDTANLVWATGGWANWVSQTNETHDGTDAAQSGPIGQNKYSRLETTIAGPAIVTFWEKAVSSGATNQLRFYIDGMPSHTLYGYPSSGWQQQTITLDAGSHTLRWDFWNYNAETNGNSAWVDQVVVTPLTALAAALDTPSLVWTTSGDAIWFAQTNTTFDGVDAAQSGSAGQGQHSLLETIVTGPATVSFWEKATNNGTYANYMYFRLDGSPHHTVVATWWSFWEYHTIYLGAGSHTLTWDFWNYGNTAPNGNCAWVDQVIVTPGGTAPIVSASPSAASSWLGGEARFRATATGTPPLCYQWSRNGVPLAGLTNELGVITGLTGADSTNRFSLTVTNNYGATTASNLSIYFTSVAAWGDNADNEITVPAAITNAVQVAVAGIYSLALRADGTIAGWGYSYGPTPPAGLSNVIAIAANWDSGLALTSDGTLVSWGSASLASQLPSGLSNNAAIASGSAHCLALRSDGTVVGWGSNQDTYRAWAGQATVPPGLSNVVAISAGDYHSLALKRDGTVVAWGANNNNTVGATPMQATVPSGISNIVAIAAGGSHNLLLRSDGTVFSWGYNGFGQTNIPAGLSNVVAVAAGYANSLALRADGTVAAWGQYYDPDLRSYQTMLVPSGLVNAARLSAGSRHSLALVGTTPPVSQSPFMAPRHDGGAFSVAIQTESGCVYGLESKNSLAEPNWTPLPLVPGDSRVKRLSDPAPAAEQRFYRVRRW